MFFRKNLIFTALFSFSLTTNSFASSNSRNHSKDEKIPIKLSAKSSKQQLQSIESNEEIEEESEGETVEQIIWVDEYKIPNNENLSGENEFTAILADTEVRVSSLPVRLQNEWFNLELGRRPNYRAISSDCVFLLRHHRLTE